MKEITMWRKEMSRKVIKWFNPNLWNITNDIIDRALDYISENPDMGTYVACGNAVADALIYTQDQWLVFEQYVFSPAEASEARWGDILGTYVIEIGNIISTFIGY